MPKESEGAAAADTAPQRRPLCALVLARAAGGETEKRKLQRRTYFVVQEQDQYDQDEQNHRHGHLHRRSEQLPWRAPARHEPEGRGARFYGCDLRDTAKIYALKQLTSSTYP
jgi:hypothetical protein